MNQRLYRSRDDRIIGGVAAGVADYLNLDPSLVRIVWAILAVFSGGLLFVLYIVMLIVVPEEPFDWSGAVGVGAPPPTPPPPPVIPGWTAPGQEPLAAPGAPVVAAAALAGTGSGPTEEGAPGTAAEGVDAAEGAAAAETAGAETTGAETTGADAAPSAEAAAAGAAPPAQAAAWIAPTTAARQTKRRRGDSFGAVVFGLILVLVGGFFLVQMYFPDIDAARFWPVVLVVIGVVFLILSFRPGPGKPQP